MLSTRSQSKKLPKTASLKPLTVKSLRAWFKNHIKDHGSIYTLDKDQSAVVLDNHKNALVTARAGAGKTRTIVAKIAYLIAHQSIAPSEIIVFAFNRKAAAEVNARLSTITFDGAPIVPEGTKIATTFHSFAYRTLCTNSTKHIEIVNEERVNEYFSRLLNLALSGTDPKTGKTRPPETRELERATNHLMQFIARSEQLFFDDYDLLSQKIAEAKTASTKTILSRNYEILTKYHSKLRENSLYNYNQLLTLASHKLANSKTSPYAYRYIFIDEYQDFSLLFLTLTRALRSTCPSAHLLAVGDDWQAINRFAGSDVKFFKHFEKYFPEDSVKLFIPTNYRSGKKIVKNANHFMGNSLNDYNGCRAANRLRSHISVIDIRNAPISELGESSVPLDIRRLIYHTINIIKSNPNKTIKILHRNNDLSQQTWSLARFVKEINRTLANEHHDTSNLSYSTIHKSKGLEADIVILLEIDVDKFPAPDHDGDLYDIFGETPETRLTDSYLLFYVAITRAKEKLFILTSTPPSSSASKTDRRRNLLTFLNPNLLS